MENGWEMALKQKELLEGLFQWQFEQTEAKTKRFSNRESVKNCLLYSAGEHEGQIDFGFHDHLENYGQLMSFENSEFLTFNIFYY